MAKDQETEYSVLDGLPFIHQDVNIKTLKTFFI